MGSNCVDLPRFDGMYKPFTEKMRNKIRGKGFTLYGLLDDMPDLAAERFFIWWKNIRDYDYYIIADVWHHAEVYQKLRQLVPPSKIAIIDPADSPRVYPFSNIRANFKGFMNKFSGSIHPDSKYFKRENRGDLSGATGLPLLLAKMIVPYALPKRILPISFSIPEEKIAATPFGDKMKTFAANIVDPEISSRVPDSFHTPLGKELYLFETEKDYYADLQESKFGITTKRSGWDCLRHYEIAANGAVICFRNLDKKPVSNAPFGLTRHNCISYDNFDDLKSQIESMDENAYHEMQKQSLHWVKQYTTRAVAQRFLHALAATE